MIVSNDIDVEYSPDDGGWYLDRISDNKTSQIFPSKQAALDALAACSGPTPPMQPLIDWS